MRVLFLSIKVAKPTARDSIAYNFIMKEMRALIASEVTVYFYSDAFERLTEVEGIRCFGRLSGWRGRLRIAAFMLRRPGFFLPRLWRDLHSALWLATTECSVRAMVERAGIDVVHTHFLWPEGECCELLARERGIPVIATLRGAELYDEPELEYGSMRNSTFRRNFASAKQHVAHFTAPNTGLLERLRTEHGIPRDRCSLVFNGVEHFDIDLPIRRAGRPPVFVVVGQFIKLKNHAWLIRSLSALRDGPPFILRLYGFGPERERLERIIAETGMSNVELCDVLPKHEIVRVMRDADALIHPSLMEGLPNVVLESLAVGTPVIVSDIPAHRDIVENGYNGYRFDLERPDELAAIVGSLLQQPERLSRLAPNCLATVGRFSLEGKIAKYLAIYADVLRQSGGSASGCVASDPRLQGGVS
jgi:glycosyltransferase involved in cell wall biosynthesis